MATVAESEHLVVERRDGRSERVPLRSDRMLIGRSEQAAVRLRDSTVSRRHAELFRDPFGRWWVRDLGAHNRTQVNGREVDEAVVRPGDVVQIGACRLRLAAPHTTTTLTAEQPSRRLTPAVEPSISPISTLAELRAPKVGTNQLSAVLEFGQRLIDMADPMDRLRALTQIMVTGVFQGMHSLVLRLDAVDDRSPAEVLCESRDDGRTDGAEPHISASVLRAVRTHGQPVATTNTRPGREQVELTITPETMPMGIIACPIRSDSVGIDLLYVCLPPELAMAEWLVLTQLAVRQYEEAESIIAANQRALRYAQLEQDLSRAQRLQRSLVPRKAMVKGLETAIGFEPCRWVGGDFVDVIAAPDGRALLLIADVCGKGLDAALVSASLHTTIRTGIRAGLTLSNMMSCLNTQLVESLPAERFVTMLVAAIDTSSGEMEIVNAGHVPPLFVMDGAIEQFEVAANLPLGVEDIGVVSQRHRLETDQVMLLCTDGLTELIDAKGKMLGKEGLSRMMRTLCVGRRPLSLHDAAERLGGLLRQYAGASPARDDMTFLMARRPG